MKKYTLYKLLSALLLVGTGSISLAQQNIQFTQYIFNSLSVNPAYAGYKEQLFAQMALRAQWTGIQDAPKTGQISIDGILDPMHKKMGGGLQISSDKLGPQSLTSAYLNYAYRLQLNVDGTKGLAVGVAAGVNQYGLNYSKLNPIDAGDQDVNSEESTSLMPDIRMGTYYYAPKFYLGVSVMDLLSDRNSSLIIGGDATTQQMLQRRMHAYIVSGLLFDLNADIKLRPSFLIKEDFKGPTSLDLNSMLIFKEKFWVGASYRTGVKLWNKKYAKESSVSNTNSVSGVFQVVINNDLRLGYSYDYALSRLKSVQNGSHEITLGLAFPQKIKRILTPRFF